jgi:hypothetical protein
MKIDYAILSSDSNPTYLDFWPIVSKIWKEHFNITPVLYYIDNNQDVEIDETYGIVIKMLPEPKVPIYLQCLWVRYWCFTQYPDDVCIISDIDMIPLSKKYFVDNISDINDEKYVHLNPCYASYGTLPSCYHVSKGKTFTKMLELDMDWPTSINKLHSLNLGRDPGGHLSGKKQWFADEKFSSDKIFEYKKNNMDDVIFLHREGGQNGFRIDRLRWSYDPSLVKSGYYYDSHSVRPYLEYKDKIDNLVNLVL